MMIHFPKSWLAVWILVAVTVSGVSYSHAATMGDQQSTLEETVRSLIEQLGDDNYHRRINAQWELQRIGLSAFEQLRVAAYTHKNFQIASSAMYIIESQDVIWWLDTDSLASRSYLTDYSSADEDERRSRIQLLASTDSPDAWLALCRLARYERHEDLSKAAALALMELLAQKDVVPDSIVNSIQVAVGQSPRTSVQWLNLAAQNLVSPADNDVDRWKAFAQAEFKTSNLDDGGQSRAQLLRLYTWLGTWITKTNGREQALEVVRPCLSLVDDQPHSVKEFAVWALDSKMPELLPDLAELQTAQFENKAELKYLLAESFLTLGNQEQAQELAQAASTQVNPSEEARKLSEARHYTGQVAKMRKELADGLAARGLFDWAEIEYQKAVLENSEQHDIEIRNSFSLFYWLAGEHAKAAAILKPLVEGLEKPKLERSPNFNNRFVEDSSFVLSSYYYYEGLSKIDDHDAPAARNNLRQAYELNPANPDIVIAMREVADDKEFNAYYEECWLRMRDEFRMYVVSAEESMSLAMDRRQRRSTNTLLAERCNQLAWLLGKCERHPDEAIHLSQRSLELSPDDPVFLDTLARCYFAAGDTMRAIETQSKAISLAPHERQMKVQLAEFQRALESSVAHPTDSPAPIVEPTK